MERVQDQHPILSAARKALDIPEVIVAEVFVKQICTELSVISLKWLLLKLLMSVFQMLVI